MLTQQVREALAEFVGTLILVFFAVGSAVFGIDRIGVVGVALAFGLVLLALAYSIGPVSGCHVNPAVTLGVLLHRGMTLERAVVYWVAQFLGAFVGAALLKLFTSGFGNVTDQTGALGTNDWGKTINGPGAFLLEVIMTFLLVFVVLLVTGRVAAPGFAGLAIGLVLSVIHLVGIPLDGTSVNPARSLGPALWNGGTPLAHVWLFILAPLIGGALAALLGPVLTPAAETGADETGADVPIDVGPGTVPASSEQPAVSVPGVNYPVASDPTGANLPPDAPRHAAYPQPSSTWSPSYPPSPSYQPPNYPPPGQNYPTREDYPPPPAGPRPDYPPRTADPDPDYPPEQE